MSRFDYIKYDSDNTLLSEGFKGKVGHVENLIEATLPNGREKSLALTKLEECFMWVGKAIRNKQIAQNKETQDHVPERG